METLDMNAQVNSIDRNCSNGFIQWAYNNLNFDFTLTQFQYQRSIANKVWNIVDYPFDSTNSSTDLDGDLNIKKEVVERVVGSLPKSRFNRLYDLYLGKDLFLSC